MVKEITFTENGQSKSIQIKDKALKFLENLSVSMDNVDSVFGHDELIIVWANTSDQWAQMIDDAMKAGIMDSYNHHDRHVVIKNM